MIKLNDYLYSGDTVFKILQRYRGDLEKNAIKTGSQVDLAHVSFLSKILDFLAHNEFLTSQSERMREFYKYLAKEYPFLAFTFKGRIKSVIRAEEKFNGYILSQVDDYYKMNGKCPDEEYVKNQLVIFRDLIAYRIVISVPKCHLAEGESQREAEIKILYKIANALPQILEKQGFSPIPADYYMEKISPLLDEGVRQYYRDYIENPAELGYESLHITLYDNMARCYIEVQLRTKSMDDNAEIGVANHLGYEKRQEYERARRDKIPVGECKFFDEAFERVVSLQQLELSKLDVNMFSAVNNSLINDGCGLFRGRQILPFEHLSRFQNDMLE